MMAEEFKGEYYMQYIRENMKYNLKSDTFCGQIPSLQHQALLKISVNLHRDYLGQANSWRDHLGQANSRLGKFNYFIFFNTTTVFKKKIKTKISNLLIPLNCKKELEHVFWQMRKELFPYFHAYSEFINFTSLDKFNTFDNICWTSQGTISKVKTACQLIEKTTLSTKEKYALACMNCLEEKIRDLIKILPKDFITDYENDDFFLVQFWTFYVRGEQEKISELTKGKETWNYLLEWAVCNGNEVAVQYVIENFDKREVNETLIESLIEWMKIHYNNDSNIYLYLWQEIPGIQRCMINVKRNSQFLRKLNRISKFSSIPPLAKYLHEIIKHFNFCDAFKIIMFCWFEEIIDKEQYITFWNELTFDSKVDLEENFMKIFKLIYRPVGGMKDHFAAKLLMEKGTPENIENLCMKNDYCSYAILSGGPVLFDNLIRQAFKVEIKISAFKNKFFNTYALYTISELIASSKFEWIEEFISRFCAADKRNQFKNDLPYIKNSNIILEIKHDSEYFQIDYLTALNNFMNWHFKGDEEEICRYTSIVFDLETDSYQKQRDIFFETVQDLIEEENWDFVEKYWKWIYCANRKEIDSMKAKWTRMIRILLLSSKGQCFSTSMGYFSRHKLFKRLATSCFKPDELEDLKELGVRNHLQFLVKELLENNRHQEVHDLIDWFFSSDETKMDEFKTSFMLSDMGLTFLFNSIKNDPDLEKVIFLFIKWLDCSIDSASLFQNRFVNFMKVKVDSERENLGQNKNNRPTVENRRTLNKINKICNILKNLLSEKINLEKRSKEVVDPNANRNSKKRVREDVLFQMKRLRICLKKCD